MVGFEFRHPCLKRIKPLLAIVEFFHAHFCLRSVGEIDLGHFRNVVLINNLNNWFNFPIAFSLIPVLNMRKREMLAGIVLNQPDRALGNGEHLVLID